jgi:hypothetical protein
MVRKKEIVRIARHRPEPAITADIKFEDAVVYKYRKDRDAAKRVESVQASRECRVSLRQHVNRLRFFRHEQPSKAKARSAQ